MTQTAFWTLTITSLVVSFLFLVEVLAVRASQSESQKLIGMQRLIREGEMCSTRWQQVALRTYQGSQQDPALKEVLVRQQIRVTPKVSANPPASPPPAR